MSRKLRTGSLKRIFLKMRSDLEVQAERLSPRAVALWGFNKMLLKAAEECAELTVQLTKRAAGSPTSDEAIVDEIADVLIVTTRLRSHFDPVQVDARIAFKLDRLERAITQHETTGYPPASFMTPPPSQL